MTCIRFFSHKAKTYTELGEQLSWLLKAKDHLKIYLQETSHSSRRKKTTFFRKKMTAADVSRYFGFREQLGRARAEVRTEHLLVMKLLLPISKPLGEKISSSKRNHSY